MGSFLLKLQLFLNKKLDCDISNPGEDCILWKGGLNSDGYGRICILWVDGLKKDCRAHRLSYMVFHQTLELGQESQMEVSHLCHVKRCVNPNHLVLEPHYSNMSRQACKISKFCLKTHTPHCIFK
jgi:hypothetical protein